MAPAVVSPAGWLPAEVYLSPQFTGAILIGAFFSWIATGVLLQQAYDYYERFKHDRLIFKLTVAVLVIINVIHSVFVFLYEYENLIVGFGNITTLTDLKWSLTSSFSISALVALIVQLFYAYRIWALLNRRVLLPLLVIAFAVAGFAFGVAMNVEAANIYITFPHPAVFNALSWLWDTTFAMPAFADLLIVVSMVVGLWRARKLDLPHASFKAIRHVLFLAVETNLLTATLCIVAAVMISTNRRPIAFAIVFNLPKAYALTLMTSLLARQSTSSGVYQFDGGVESTGVRRIGGSESVSTVLDSPVRAIKIATHTETVIEKEDGVLEMLEDGLPRRQRAVPLTFSPQSISEKSESSSSEDLPALAYS